MSPSNGNGAGWAEVFAAFHSRHRAGNKKMQFTAVFNAAMDAFILCPDVPPMWRLLAWIWRHSWGNSSDCCVDGIGGTQIGQQVAADFFRVDKRRVSDWVADLRTFHFLLPSTGHALYPIDNPAVAEAPEATENTESPAPSGLLGNKRRTLYQEYCDEWKSVSPADFQELQSAEDTVSRIKKVRLGGFRPWKRARTSGGASLYTTEQHNNRAESSSSAVPVGPSEVKADEEEPTPVEVQSQALTVPEQPATFEEFKQAYPPKSLDAAKAKPIFEALSPEKKRKCIERLHVYRGSPRWQKSPQFIPLASNWLKSDYEEPPPPYFEAAGGEKKGFTESVMEEAQRRFNKWGEVT